MNQHVFSALKPFYYFLNFTRKSRPSPRKIYACYLIRILIASISF